MLYSNANNTHMHTHTHPHTLAHTHTNMHGGVSKGSTLINKLDFSKVFDTVPQNRLLHKLSSYGITGSLHLWVQNFLTQQRMKVVSEGKESHEVPVDSSVP